MRAEQTWDDGTVDDINIETLQPISWLKEFGIQPGRQAPIPLELVEMGMEENLTATVLDVLPCPAIEQGPGKVVLTTVDHLNRDVLELKVRQHDGRLDTIRTTGSHKFYSQTNDAWVSASDLASGESLHGMHGSITALGSQRVPGTHRVYNMTVEDEHVYRVASLGILVHNTQCDTTLYKAPLRGRSTAADEVVNGYSPANYPGNGPHFSSTRTLAEEFQFRYQNGLQEINIPSNRFDELVAEGIIQPDPEYSLGYSWFVPAENLPAFNQAIQTGGPNVYTPQLPGR